MNTDKPDQHGDDYLFDEDRVELSPEEQAVVDESWRKEIARRSQEITDGTAKLVPWEEVLALLRRHQGKQP